MLLSGQPYARYHLPYLPSLLLLQGFNHPDAPPLDVQSAAAQLAQATRDTLVGVDATKIVWVWGR